MTTAVVTALVAALVGCQGTSTTPDRAHADVAAALRADLDADATGLYRNLGAVVLTVDGRTVLQQYRGAVTAATPVDVGSIGGTVLGTLVGIALAEGRLPGLDATLTDLLPGRRAELSDDAARVTLGQLLTMTAGVLDDERWHTELARDPQADRSGWLLRHGVVREPGSSYVYSDANYALTLAVLEAAVGADALDYAREKLFGPLGFDDRPASGRWADLRLTAPELAALGQLWLDDGAWHGRQLVPAAWVRRMATQTASVGDTAVFAGYGTSALTDTADGHPALVAADRSGQLVEVVPDLGLVAVFGSTVGADPAQQIGVAGPTAYADLVNLTVAPRLS